MTNIFTTPGNADNISEELLTLWNKEVLAKYQNLKSLHSKFFKLNPSDLNNAKEVPIKWFGDPAEPAFCLDKHIAQKLADWGVKGRRETHNEYCEYRLIERRDKNGDLRPKRVEVTTELREYWVLLAKHEPRVVKDLAESILKKPVSWEELYGVKNPNDLSPREREIEFSKLVAGHGQDDSLKKLGVPPDPQGSLNGENALFMAHPINGLDDLLYIVLFGAKPYALQDGNELKPVDKESLFKNFNVLQLACRHADPAAAMGAHGAVFGGSTVSFTNSIGMYLHSFAKNKFLYNDAELPDAWIQFSRGTNGMHQRLEFGPSDQEDVFLDDIFLYEGGSKEAVIGGFQIVKNIEVGPFVMINEPKPISKSDYVILPNNSAAIDCTKADICAEMKKLYSEYQNSLVTGITNFARTIEVKNRY